jgi:DNA repair protein SbcD/Mre11
VIDEQEIDALLISGDVFETANPPASAQEAWYHFIADTRRRRPELEIVVIGGNHDSAARLDAPSEILGEMGVRVVGGLPRLPTGELDLERLVVPLHDSRGKVGAWVAAVPFLRPVDLPAAYINDVDADPLIEGVRAVYAEVLDSARGRRRPGQALVGMGHCYMVGGEISELSERRILGGNQHALPVSLFPDDVAYVALGHLHRPQRVGGRSHVRYSGSPIPLSLAEADYPHQVIVAELVGEHVGAIRELRVPRFVPILRVPWGGPKPLLDVLAALAKLEPREPGMPDEERPYLEVRLSLPAAEPGFRRQIDDALEGKAARLVRLSVDYTGDGRALAESARTDLREVTPEEVFKRLYAKLHEDPPPYDLLDAFQELVEQVEGAA